VVDRRHHAHDPRPLRRDRRAANARLGPVNRRLAQGVRKPANWKQLVKFCTVGGSGYVVNLIVFTFFWQVLEVHHLAAATAAFAFAVTNNFWWNRNWTFAARDGHAGFQAARFFAISLFAFAFAAAILEGLVRFAHVPEVPAQAISIIVATPLNFVGNKMWSFAARPAPEQA
jgi:putative flippase GtrA